MINNKITATMITPITHPAIIPITPVDELSPSPLLPALPAISVALTLLVARDIVEVVDVDILEVEMVSIP